MKLYKVGLIIFIFIAIFSPPLLPFNTLFIITGISILGFSVNNGGIKICYKDRHVFYLMLFLLIYILGIVLLGGLTDLNGRLVRNRIIIIYQVYALVPMQFICAKYVINILRTKEGNDRNVLKYIVISGLIEVACVIVAFLVPSVRNIMLDNIIKNGGKAYLYGNDAFLLYRGYGWADTLLDTFGYGMGLLAGSCLLFESFGKKRYVLMIAFLFATLVNSRTGLAIFLVAFVVWIIKTLKTGNISKMVRTALGILLIVSIILVALQLNVIPSSTISWAEAGFRSIWNKLIGRQEAYRVGSMQNSILTLKMWTLPDNIINLIFGTGHSIFGAGLDVYSDVGYVNYIWICGLLGTILLLIVIYKWYKSEERFTASREYRTIKQFLIIAFFVMFVKGNVISHTAGTFITILLMVSNEDRYANKQVQTIF